MLDMPSLQEDLNAVTQSVDKANGLPNALYADPAAIELERQKIFYDGWACIGFGKDVPNNGDAKPVDYLGTPLLVARDHDGNVNVFHNVCRHRGMILVEEAKNFGGVMRCPYHSWCYSMDGKLRATPHVGGPGINNHDSIDRVEAGLTRVRMALFMDMVFVNLSGNAETFEERIEPLRNRIPEFVDREIFHGDSFQLDVKTNWKLAVENYCESYHLPWIHPGLNSYSRLEDHYHIEAPRQFSGQGTLVYNPDFGEGLDFPNFPDLTEKWDQGAEYIAIYPNVLIGVHRDHTFNIMIEPKTNARSVEHIELYYTTEEAATSDKYASIRKKNAAMWKEVFMEDIFVVEGMQKGRGAAGGGSGFDGGVFSPVMDSPTHCFHDWVASRIAE